MTERRNTMICAFDPKSPKISAYDIHEWIYETLRIPDQEVTMIQVDGIKIHVYIKLLTEQIAHKIIQDTNGRITYKHPDGLITTVLIELAGMGIKSIRMANPPPPGSSGEQNICGHATIRPNYLHSENMSGREHTVMRDPTGFDK
jgi:hypothetical protein